LDKLDRLLMLNIRYNQRLVTIAFMVIVAALSLVSECSASSPGEATSSGSRACPMIGSSCTVCCCDPVSAPMSPAPIATNLSASPTDQTVRTPVLPCECRSSDSSTPASSPATRVTENRAGQDRVELLSLPSLVPVATFSARFDLPAASAPKSPLYIRNARILI
jgi:hypothetical protein